MQTLLYIFAVCVFGCRRCVGEGCTVGTGRRWKHDVCIVSPCVSNRSGWTAKKSFLTPRQVHQHVHPSCMSLNKPTCCHVHLPPIDCLTRHSCSWQGWSQTILGRWVSKMPWCLTARRWQAAAAPRKMECGGAGNRMCRWRCCSMRGMPITLCVHTCNHMTMFVSGEGPSGPIPHSAARVGRPQSHSIVC